MSYQYAYLDYNHTHPSNCKVDAFIRTFPFSARQAFPGPECPDPGTTWTRCIRDKTIAVGRGTSDAVAYRIFFESTSSAALLVDWAGVYDRGI